MRRPHPLIFRIGTPFHLKVFGLIFLAMALGVMPLADQEIKRISGGTGRLDWRFYYTPGQVYSHLEALGGAGRSMYGLVEATAGNLFPFSYLLFLTALLSWLGRRVKREGYWLLGWLPIGMALADWMENAGILALLWWYPQEAAMLVWCASAMTMAKWAAAGLCAAGIGFKLAGGARPDSSEMMT